MKYGICNASYAPLSGDNTEARGEELDGFLEGLTSDDNVNP
jgi:hypothetical protein